MLTADDYKYFSFQLWQEGIGRYTQYKFAELAARKMKPSKRFRELKDFTSYKVEADNLLRSTSAELKGINIAELQRVAFYPFGGIEGLLLDRVTPYWKENYFINMFALENNYRRVGEL
jgi:hypothetical protein